MLRIIIIVIGILLILESFFVLISPKRSVSIMKMFAKEKFLKGFGILELIIGLIVLVAGIFIVS